MVTGDASRQAVFVDTNVLVAAAAARSPSHLTAVQALSQLESLDAPVWISRQVLREYLAVLSRPQTFATALPVADLVHDVRNFESRFNVAGENEVVTAHLLSLLAEVAVGGKQVHDANIVATMLANGVTQLFTGNPTDFTRYAHHVRVLPLVLQSTS